jgi:DNA-binding MarR family transcriptional regulator
LHVHTCIFAVEMKLEQAIQSNKFKNEVQKAGLNIMYTAWWLKTLGCKELKEFGLTHEQFNVLRILKGKHPEQMCVKDIAGRMIEKNSNVPRILDRLEEKKLIERTQGAEDARQTVMSLTEQGIQLLASSSCRMDTTMAENTTMSEEDAKQLNLLLEKFRALES